MDRAYVIKSGGKNKYLGFDSRFIFECDTVHGSTLFKTREAAEKCIEHYRDETLEYKPLAYCEPVEVVALEYKLI